MTINLKRVTAALSIAALALGLLALATHGSFSSQAHAADSSVAATPDAADVQQSQALVSAPAVKFESPSPTHSSESDLRATGQRLEEGVPLPPGASLDDIDWAAAAAQGGDNESGMTAVIQYRAACKWYAYAAAGKPDARTLAVVNAIPQWPTFRGTNKQPVAEQVASALAVGNQKPVQDQLALNCK